MVISFRIDLLYWMHPSWLLVRVKGNAFRLRATQNSYLIDYLVLFKSLCLASMFDLLTPDSPKHENRDINLCVVCFREDGMHPPTKRSIRVSINHHSTTRWSSSSYNPTIFTPLISDRTTTRKQLNWRHVRDVSSSLHRSNSMDNCTWLLRISWIVWWSRSHGHASSADSWIRKTSPKSKTAHRHLKRGLRRYSGVCVTKVSLD